ncbi:MAG: hypothetical protein FWB74_03600 [Defluviitaleaceae bacterium]|nr:hypothetical protein [Defluviitaleaceae bacterium]
MSLRRMIEEEVRKELERELSGAPKCPEEQALDDIARQMQLESETPAQRRRRERKEEKERRWR